MGPIRGYHQGQRPGHLTAPDRTALMLLKTLAKRRRPHMTEPAETLVSDGAPAHSRAPRRARRSFEVVGPALKNQPLTFLCEDREYRYGSSAEPTVIRISDSGVYGRILTEGNLGLAECYMDKKVEVVHGSLEHFVV